MHERCPAPETGRAEPTTSDRPRAVRPRREPPSLDDMPAAGVVPMARAGRIRVAADGLIRRKPDADDSWKPGWGWSGKWTQDDVDKELRRVIEAWDTAKKALDGLNTVVDALRDRAAFAKELEAVGKTVTGWDRKVSWTERTAAIAALTAAFDTISGLRGRADERKRTDDAQAATESAAREEKQRKHQALMAGQQAAKQKRIADAAETERQKIADAAEAERQRREDEAREERERVASEEESRRKAKEEAARIKAEEEAARKRKEEEDARKAKVDRERAGREAWSVAVGTIADSTDANAARTVPDTLGTTPKQVAEVDAMLAAERTGIDAGGWDIAAVNAVFADLAGMKRRWSDHVLAAAHGPRKTYEERSERTSGAPIKKLGIDAAKLWRFFGYPDAHGRDYAMPRFQIGAQWFHLSLTGNSMRDLSVIWKADPTILAQHPEEIFTALFVTDIRPDRRVHATSELEGRHVYLGGVNGDGVAIPDHFFGGDAGLMMEALDRFRAEIVAKLWDAKAKFWVLE